MATPAAGPLRSSSWDEMKGTLRTASRRPLYAIAPGFSALAFRSATRSESMCLKALLMAVASRSSRRRSRSIRWIRSCYTARPRWGQCARSRSRIPRTCTTQWRRLERCVSTVTPNRAERSRPWQQGVSSWPRGMWQTSGYTSDRQRLPRHRRDRLVVRARRHPGGRRRPGWAKFGPGPPAGALRRDLHR